MPVSLMRQLSFGASDVLCQDCKPEIVEGGGTVNLERAVWDQAAPQTRRYFRFFRLYLLASFCPPGGSEKPE